MGSEMCIRDRGSTLSLESSSNEQPRLTRRQRRLQNYLANRYPEWGSKSSRKLNDDDKSSRKLNDDEAWVTDDIAGSSENDWYDERPAKQQRCDSDQSETSKDL